MDEIQKNSLFADERNRYPRSRDWEIITNITINCLRTTCAACHSKVCVMPSLIQISSTGKCLGYHKRK